MNHPVSIIGASALCAQVIGQLPIDDAWGKIFLQLGIAGVWIYCLNNQLDKQTKRDDKRHEDNIAIAKEHSASMQKLTVVCYDVLEEVAEAYPNARAKIREAMRREARLALDHNVTHEHK